MVLRICALLTEECRAAQEGLSRTQGSAIFSTGLRRVGQSAGLDKLGRQPPHPVGLGQEGKGSSSWMKLWAGGRGLEEKVRSSKA